MDRARRQAVEAQAAAWVSALVTRLPRRAALALGRGFGRVWGDLDRRHFGIAADNLRRSFPEWDEARVRRTARGVYAHFGQVLFDILWLAARPASVLNGLVEFEGGQHAEAALRAGRGVVFPTLHIGSWEVNALAHSLAHGPVGVVARPLDNAALDARLVAFRRSTGNTVIYKERAIQQVLRLLRAGGGIGFLVDQNMAEDQGVFVEFFGRPAATSNVVALLAEKTGCAIVPGWTQLLPGGRYRLVYKPAIDVTPLPGEEREARVLRLTQRIARIHEEAIRETPEQWLWLHRRWKTQPRPAAEGRE
jgi:KDO2-lipid IV(A) lauroyltransferase